MPARNRLEANIVSYLLKGQMPNTKLRHELQQADTLASSSTTEEELF
jgi:hypothetical protein